MTTSGDLLALAAAGVAAGAVNAVAGGGSLIAFPVLLWLGYPPITANVTNTVAAVPGYVSGTWGYRSRLTHQRRRMVVLGAVSVVGSLVGACLLLLVSASTFQAVAPVLVAMAAVALGVQPLLTRATRARRRGENPRGAMVGQLLMATYGGYFSAGLGILMLAVLGLVTEEDLQELNALKGFLSIVIGAVSSIFFVCTTPIAWAAAGVLALTGLVGGRLGVALAQRLPAVVLRSLIVGYGLVVAVCLGVKNAS